MRKFVLGMAAISMLGLAACETQGGQQWGMNKQNVGAGVGAVAGGLLGSQVGKGDGQLWATGAGVLLGALIGSQAGASLDRADQLYAQKAMATAQTAPVGETIEWNNPESGNSGSYTPVREGTSKTSGSYCREYQQTVIVGGQEQSAYGTACQQPDGSWKIVNN